MSPGRAFFRFMCENQRFNLEEVTMKTRMLSRLALAAAGLFAVVRLSYADPLWSRVIASWPENARNTAREIAEKYGAPDMVGADVLVWNHKGPYAWIRVNAMEVQHNFPIGHKDVLDIAIPYRVPISKLNLVGQFDGSSVVMRTKGLLVASCFKEELDLLILNLTHDVVMGKKSPAEARMAFGKIATGMMKGQRNPYTDALQFKLQPLSATRDPDKELSM